MIRSSFLTLFIFIQLSLFSQTAFDLEISKALEIVERNLTISNREYIKKERNEFFLYYVSLDTLGKISNINILRQDNSCHKSQIREVSLKIKDQCNFLGKTSKLKAILIPVLLIHQEAEGENDFIEKIAAFFGNAKKTPNSEIYITRQAIIAYYQTKDK